MSDQPRRDMRELKELEIKKLIDCYQSTNRTMASRKVIEKFERLVEHEVLPMLEREHDRRK